MNISLRAAVTIGVLSLVALPVHALPITPQVAGAAMAVADRDSVRDPYNIFGSLLNQAAVNAIPIARGLVTSSGIVGSGFGLSGFSGIGGFVPRVAPLFISAPPPSGGVYFSFSNARPQSNVVIGAVQVPEGGITLILLGASLMVLVLIRHTRAIASWLKD